MIYHFFFNLSYFILDCDTKLWGLVFYNYILTDFECGFISYVPLRVGADLKEEKNQIVSKLEDYAIPLVSKVIQKTYTEIYIEPSSEL